MMIFLKKEPTFYITKKWMFLMLFCWVPLVLFSQQLKVSGTIKDAKTNDVLPGVSIVIKGTTTGTSSGMDGDYSIQAKINDILIFSYLGYEAKEVKITTQNLNISLEESAQSLDEIVLIGYGSSKKKDLTGAVTTVTEKDFQQGFVTNAEQLIANKIPGVQITPVSGQPGAGSSFLIRGGASLGASNNPLFVIDGNPIGLADGPGILSALNPEDIASFSVLKDAAAAAIYGSRGSNGVILITTKKGRSNELKFSLSTKASISQNFLTQSVLSGDQFREVAQRAEAVSGTNILNNLGNENTDWQDEIFQNALTTEASMSVSGGIKNLPYRLSLGYLDQEGTLRTGNFQRTTATLNVNPVLFDGHLKVNVNVKAILQDQRIADQGAIFTATTFDPTQPVLDPNSPFGGYWQYTEFASNPAVLRHYNPVSMLEQVENKNKNLRSIGNIQLDYKLHFFPDLKVNLNTGYDIAESSWSYFTPADYFPANISNGNNSSGDPGSKTENVFLEATLNYAKEIKSIKSRVEALAGYSYNDFKTTNYFYPSFDVDGVLQPGSEPNFDFDIPQNTLISYFGRLIYALHDKYILTGTIRTDGSSRFSQNNRWGVFPSVSGAWKISDEKFLENSKTISNLKLRLGYGITGQQEGIGNYGYIPIYNLGEAFIQYPIGNGFVQGVNPTATDRNRKWEQSTTYNIGLDWGLFNNRVSGSFEVYLRETEDLLNNVSIPSGTDFANNITKNIGSLENRGFELKIDANPIQSKDFNWYLGFNYGYNENKITSLSEDNDSSVGLFNGSILVNTVGFQRNTFYLYRQVYDANGNPIEDQMVDINQDGTINEQDRYRSESSVPRHNLGFNTSFNYKKVSLNMAFHANLGHYIFFRPNDNLASIYDGIFRGNVHTDYFDTQFTQNGNANQGFSDHYLQNASFLKMDNISLNYDLGNILNSEKNSNLALSASVQNVFILTDFEGGDPESPFNFGSNFGGNYTAPRTFSLALNFNF
ncbi:TonB-dependent receptor [Polaribacter litorisediminis]|uniref:SusC/RagA family TonB-linked outer membrane protein n=1 Tax=Polaribacter litorisediminis TaxID=1908341 RepID=UPI001CBEB49C|nr:TonB-dependent receptor [Polaribacter litorisediminis]UAM98725.1 TonB-dependent receptor [Polaribacter litorisediminis]